MTKPPERIHVLVGGSPVCRVLRQEWLLEPSEIAVTVEYIRADLATQRTPDPAVQALVDLLREARADLAVYVDTDWPEPQRSQYKPLQAKWKRDMELCWRIDAALAAFDKT